MKTVDLERVIMYDGKALADINPAMNVNDVLKYHSTRIPELATANVEGPTTENGKLIYTVKSRLGTKG